MTLKPNLVVVLGDAVASRAESDRSGMEQKLRATCDALNAGLGPELRAPFQPIKGIDEFGGVLERGDRLHRVVVELATGLHPVAYRIAAARGGIDTGLDTSDVSRMDGPAFHTAAASMAALKSSRLLVDASLGEPGIDGLLTAYLNLLAFRVMELSPRQLEIVRAVEREGTQEGAAAALGITQQAVSQGLVRARWSELERLQRRVDDALAANEEARS